MQPRWMNWCLATLTWPFLFHLLSFILLLKHPRLHVNAVLSPSEDTVASATLAFPMQMPSHVSFYPFTGSSKVTRCTQLSCDLTPWLTCFGSCSRCHLGEWCRAACRSSTAFEGKTRTARDNKLKNGSKEKGVKLQAVIIVQYPYINLETF